MSYTLIIQGIKWNFTSSIIMTISIACTLKLCIEHKSTDLIAFVNAKDFILGEQRRNNPHNARFFCKFYKNE